MENQSLLLLVAVLLPPKSLDVLGEVVDEQSIDTPYGRVGPIARRRGQADSAVWVQPYTGAPTRTDPRATLYAARQLGVRAILNWDSGVALNPVLRRGQPAIAVDYIDWTRHQPTTFASSTEPGTALATPVPATPLCPQMIATLQRALPDAPPVVYLGTDGPRRETPAEARMFRLWGADVIGQNMTPEAALAAELAIPYAGLVTVAAHGADMPIQQQMGDVRAGLEYTIQAFPRIIQCLGPLQSLHNSGS